MLSRLILPLLLTAGLLATATLARADERCTGTFCDLYYGGPPTDPSKPAPQVPAKAADARDPLAQLPPGATPLFAPKFLSSRTNPDGTPAAADPSPSRVQVQGGGLIGLMNGTAPERCSGTICDLYYGGPPSEEKPGTPAPGAASATAVVDQEAAAPPPMDERETVHRAPPSCAAKGRDPWSCYR